MNKDTAMNDKFITKQEALKELGYKSGISLYRLAKAGKIVINKVNAKVIYYSLNSIKAYKAGLTA